MKTFIILIIFVTVMLASGRDVLPGAPDTKEGV